MSEADTLGPLELAEPSECECEECVKCCHHTPGWCTPDDAEALIAGGYGDRLMNDWWVGGGPDDADIQVLCPAAIGREGGRASEAMFRGSGTCWLLNDERCEVHGTDMKPSECRLSTGCSSSPKHWREHIKDLWNTGRGRGIVAAWRRSQE